MDSAEKIAIAELASILSKVDLINPYERVDIWPDILRRAGFSSIAEKQEQFLVPYTYNGSYENPNPRFSKRYSSIYGILSGLKEEDDPFTDEPSFDWNAIRQLLKAIVEEIDPLNTVRGELGQSQEDILSKFDLSEERIERKKREALAKIEKDNTLWEKFGATSFKRFLRALRILSLDVRIENGALILRQFSAGAVGREHDISALETWLALSHPEVLKAYSDALNNYQEGRAGSCISDCRVALTGLFSNYASTKDWFNGVLQLTPDTYKDPGTVLQLKDVSKIMQDKIEGDFPRFKVIYRIYSLYCELGSHRTEGVEEDPSLNDALWSLRLLEDILIWAMNVLPTPAARGNNN